VTVLEGFHDIAAAVIIKRCQAPSHSITINSVLAQAREGLFHNGHRAGDLQGPWRRRADEDRESRKPSPALMGQSAGHIAFPDPRRAGNEERFDGCSTQRQAPEFQD